MPEAHPIPTNGRFQNLTGRKFEHLVVQYFIGTINGKSWWICLCKCGRECKACTAHLNDGSKDNCGCMKEQKNREASTTHGKSYSKEYGNWRAMLNRCLYPTHVSYADYGGRGITVCARWIEFANFYVDMGDKPSPKHSIERRENDKGYYPENCYWGTPVEQGRNKGRIPKIECRGESKTAAEWSQISGTPTSTMRHRLKIGWDAERAIFEKAQIVMNRISLGPISPDIGQRIRAIREGMGMSQDALGEKSGLHRGSVCQIECGHKRTSPKSLSALASALNVTADYLRNGTPDPIPADLFTYSVRPGSSLAAESASPPKEG